MTDMDEMEENEAVEHGSEAAERWLPLRDAADVGPSWDDTSTLFRRLVDREQWRDSLAKVDALFGRPEERELATVRYTTSVPGAPDGHYVLLEYNARFARKQEAVETVVVMRDEDDAWRVSGYFVR
jgi:hypothetical protein